MCVGYSVFSIEKWPEEARRHFHKHLAKGTLICSRMPRDTLDQRYERAKRHIQFYLRCKVHVMRMHPYLSSSPLGRLP